MLTAYTAMFVIGVAILTTPFLIAAIALYKWVNYKISGSSGNSSGTVPPPPPAPTHPEGTLQSELEKRFRPRAFK